MSPLANIIGLSFFVHLLIVGCKAAGNFVLSFFPKRTRDVMKLPPKFGSAFAFIFITVIGISVLTSAALIVESGFQDRRASFKLAREASHGVGLFASNTALYFNLTQTASAETVSVTCAAPLQTTSDFSTDSLVEYLVSRGLPSSLEVRESLAAHFNIESYSGSARENRQLLYALRQQELVALTSSQCQKKQTSLLTPNQN